MRQAGIPGDLEGWVPSYAPRVPSLWEEQGSFPGQLGDCPRVCGQPLCPSHPLAAAITRSPCMRSSAGRGGVTFPPLPLSYSPSLIV